MMRECLRMVLLVFVLGTGNSSYSLTKYPSKINEKKPKKSLTCMHIYVYDLV